MLRRLALIALLTPALVPTLPAAAAAPPPASERIAAQINDARRAHGLRPLRTSPSLMRSSRGFARRLVRSNRFAHAPRLPISPAFRVRGETLARLARPRRDAARRVVAAWLRSPGHRALLLDPRFRWIGVGGHRTVWVAHLGRR